MATEHRPALQRDEEALQRYWRKNLRLGGALLALWALVVLLAAIFARPLNEYSLLGIPLAFYIFAQGAPLFFLAIIGFYARAMNRADRLFAENCSASKEISPRLSKL